MDDIPASPNHSPLCHDPDQAILPCDSRVILSIIYFTDFIIYHLQKSVLNIVYNIAT